MPEQKPQNVNKSEDNMRADNRSARNRNEDAQRMRERERSDERVKKPADHEEQLLNEAEEAVSAMEMRELRRSGSYRTGGDDHNVGIDTGIDSNAPKDTEVSGTRRGGSRGKSDGR